MTDAISTIAELEACLGPAGLGALMKQIDHLDAGASRWLGASPLAFVAAADADDLQVTLAGGAPGFARAEDPHTLALPADSLDDKDGLAVGQGAGLLFLVPGITETLRVNGRIASLGGEIRIAVEEVYIHCGKALIRSEFWAAEPATGAAQTDAALLDSVRFIALATADAEGRADMSPKGDPAGRMVRLAGDTLVFADRPGNRRADGFRNILSRPATAAVALVPGTSTVAYLRGRARLTRDEQARSGFTVDDKMPQLVTVMDDAAVERRESAALARARLWPLAAAAGHGVDTSAILVGHVKANKMKGEQADAVRGGAAVDGVRKGLAQSYETGLY